ncbi:MAG: hypothetical protein NZ519_12295 [Bacteroidia bacterium]|nr:hypothetical protein [Bacteroidia bacterium]
MLKTYLLLILSWGILPQLYAQCTLTFTGQYGTNWHTNGNWDKWKVPGPNDNVIIPAGKTVNISSDAECRTITVHPTGQVIKPSAVELLVTNASNTGFCNYKKAFVSGSSGYPDGIITGNMGGLAGADNLCQTIANTYIPGNTATFKAWLSSSTVAASARLTHASIPYRARNEIIADNWADLTDGTLDNALVRLVQALAYCGSCWVWTNTTPTGGIFSTNPNNNCNNWTSNSSSLQGRAGVSDPAITNAGWTDTGYYSCSNDFPLYCLEQ